MRSTAERLTAKSFYPVDGAKKPSWFIIVIMFFVFLPVGIYMLHKRVKLTKGRNAASAVTMAWSGFCTILMLLCIIGDGGIEFWVATAVFAFCWFYGMGERVQGGRYDTYIAILMSGEWYLPIIADTIGRKRKEAINDLKEMFKDGIFPGSYIDMSNLTVETNYSCLAKMGMYAPALKTIYVNEADYPQVPDAKIVVRCKGCGANVEGVLGKTGTCEFCDSSVSFM